MPAKSALLKGVHAHGCPKCKHRFEDFCQEPFADKECPACRTGYLGWPELRENRLPKDCCRLHSRPIRKGEAEQFRLGSTCPWYLCKECARTHPFRNPTEGQA